jgi:hypothetical protein
MTRSQPLRSFRTRRREAEAEKGTDSTRRWSPEWIYFAFVVAAWCFTPLLRRLIDFHNGAFHPVTVRSLIRAARVDWRDRIHDARASCRPKR